MKQRSPLYFAWRRFAANKAVVLAGTVLSGTVLSGTVLATLILMAVFAPLITKTGYEAQDFPTQSLAFPSADFWFGIDDLGRDFFTRIVYGARVSLTIGFTAALFSVLIGIPLGALAGYYGGGWDWAVMRLIELFSVVPPLSFLRIGVPPPTPSWGQMINTGMNFMYFHWHMAVIPTAALAITMVATTLFGDGLRDALDPTLKGR